MEKFTALGSVHLHVTDTSSINTLAEVVNTKSIKLMITTRHIKAARALLAWSQETLAERSGVSIPTIKRLEAEDGALGGRAETSEKIRTALQAAGIEFTNGDAPGVRLKRGVRGPTAESMMDTLARNEAELGVRSDA